MDDVQNTPRGHPDFNSYMKILRVFIDNRQTDRRTEKLIRCGLGNLIGSSRYTRCAWAGGTFLRSLRKVPQAHAQSACVLQELGWKYR
jgi:hypothetical protein